MTLPVHQTLLPSPYLGELAKYLQRRSDLQQLRYVSASKRQGKRSVTRWLAVVDGLPAPGTLNLLISNHNLALDALVGHLDLERVLYSVPTSFPLPQAPAAATNFAADVQVVMHLTVSQLGCFNAGLFTDMTILEQQTRADEHVLAVEKQLLSCIGGDRHCNYGGTRLRKLNIHNSRYFSIEHLVTLVLWRDSTRTSVVLMDHIGKPMRPPDLERWMNFEPCFRRSPALLPTVPALSSLRFTSPGDEGDGDEGDGDDDLSTRLVAVLGDSKFQPPELCGASTGDCQLLLHGTVAAALGGWGQILGMLEQCNERLETTAPEQSANALAQLRCNISFLGRLLEHVRQAKEAVSSFSSDASSPSSPLMAHCDGLLGRGNRLRERFNITSQLLAGAAQAVEAQRGIEQAARVHYLTRLAFFFVPLSFVTSFFGMNMKLLQDLPLWHFFVTAFILLIATIIPLGWHHRFSRLCAHLRKA